MKWNEKVWFPKNDNHSWLVGELARLVVILTSWCVDVTLAGSYLVLLFVWLLLLSSLSMTPNVWCLPINWTPLYCLPCLSLSVCCWLTDHRSSFCFLLFVFFFPLPLLFGSLFLSVLPSTFELRLGAPFWLFLPVFCRYFCFGLLTVFSAVSTLAATAVAVVSGFVLLFASALFLVVQFSPSFSLPFSPSFVHLAACYLFSNSLLLLLLQVCLLACFASIIIIISHSLFCVIIGRRKLCFCLLAKLTKGCSSIRRAA